MVLPNAILFPGALLPLYIFETRYRRMLADCLNTHRTFAIAMQKPGCIREIPSSIAGLGLIRVAVTKKDRTSYLILQGLSRIELGELQRRQPYRVYRVRPLETAKQNTAVILALMAKLRYMITQRLNDGSVTSQPVVNQKDTKTNLFSVESLAVDSLKQFIKYLAEINDPGQIADLVSCTLLSNALHRQTVLETVDLEKRLRQVIQFLQRERKKTL